MTSRITRRGALAGTLALAAPAIAVAQAPQTITMWTFLDPARPGGRERALKQMIDSFEAANSTLRIRVEPQVWTTMAERFVLGHNARNAPDICWVNDKNLGLILGDPTRRRTSSRWWMPGRQERRADQLLPAALQSVTQCAGACSDAADGDDLRADGAPRPAGGGGQDAG